MPTLLRWKGYRFFFWIGEDADEPPHIHIDKDGRSAKIWLAPLAVAWNDGYAPHEINRLLKVVEEHKHMFLEAWYDYFGG